MSDYPRFLAAGDGALLVEFGDRIDEDLNRRVLALAATLQGEPGLREIIPTYRSLTLVFDALIWDHATLQHRAQQSLADGNALPDTARRWRVPVCYGGEYGIDLEELARRHGLSADAVITLHSQARYRVYMVGFMPGFAYLGGLPAALHTPRRASPRAATPASSVNIGGQQTAISSVAGPSGWHLIGRTPWRTFDADRPQACLFQAGDEIRFQPVRADQFDAMAAACAAPDWRPTPEAAI